jgi:hypothetical protein
MADRLFTPQDVTRGQLTLDVDATAVYVRPPAELERETVCELEPPAPDQLTITD